MRSIILAGAALTREREHGTVEHLLVILVTPAEIMLAKVRPLGLVDGSGRPAGGGVLFSLSSAGFGKPSKQWRHCDL